MNRNIALIAIMMLALGITGCDQKGKNEAAKPAVQAQAQTALVVPPAEDNRAWKLYLSNVVKQHMEGIRSSPFMYYLPAEDAEDFEEQFNRQRDNVASAVFRGVLPGNMLAFGSPSSERMAELIAEAFEGVSSGSMKDVRVLFIGNEEDLEKVRTAVEPTGANVVFHQVK